MEGSGDGIASHPDEFYRTWPRAWEPTDEPGGWYLKSMSPAEELAGFLATRASCLEDNGRLADAIQSLVWAVQLVPKALRYGWQLVKLMRQQYESGLRQLEHQKQLLASHWLRLQDATSQAEKAAFLPLPTSGGPPHGDYCQCFHCRQAREASRRIGMPGHPPGCGCVHCHQPNFHPFVIR